MKQCFKEIKKDYSLLVQGFREAFADEMTLEKFLDFGLEYRPEGIVYAILKDRKGQEQFVTIHHLTPMKEKLKIDGFVVSKRVIVEIPWSGLKPSDLVGIFNATLDGSSIVFIEPEKHRITTIKEGIEKLKDFLKETIEK